MKKFKLFWNNGTSSTVVAPDITEAYKRFSPNQLEDLDFYCLQ